MASYPTATAYPAAADADVPMGTIATGVPVAARVVAPPATLTSKGFPAGLYGMLQSSVQAFPIRFVVVDNSGYAAQFGAIRRYSEQFPRRPTHYLSGR